MHRYRKYEGKSIQLLLFVSFIISSVYGFVKTLQAIDKYPNLSAWTPNYILLPTALMLFGMIFLRGDQSSRSRFRIACLINQPSRPITSLFIIVCFISIFLFSFALLLFYYRLDEIGIWKDTLSYVRVAGYSVDSTSFWFGERPFSYPIVLKSFGIVQMDKESDMFWALSTKLTQFQSIISLISFSFLGVSVGSFLRGNLSKIIVFTLSIGIGLGMEVFQWNKIILTESLSTSSFVIIVSIVLFGLRHFHSLSNLFKASWIVCFTLSITFFSFLRDTNIYLLLLFSITVLILSFRKSNKRLISSYSSLLVLVFSFCLFVLQYRGQNIGRRWYIPYINILHERIIPNQHATDYYLEQGMPEVALSFFSLDRRSLFTAIDNDPEFELVHEWIIESGRITYLRYLLANPVETLLAPIQSYESFIAPDSSEYRHEEYTEPPWVQYHRELVFPSSSIFILIASIFVLGLMLTMKKDSNIRNAASVPFAMLALVYPMMVLIWIGDAIEVERHAFQVAIQIRLAIFIMLVFGIEDLLGRIRFALPNHSLPPTSRSG